MSTARLPPSAVPRGRLHSIAAVAVICVTVVGGVVPPASAAETAPAPVVFIVDASGSMVRDAGGRTRMAVAQEATRSAIDALPAATPTGLLVFGTGTGNNDSEREAGCRDVVTLSPVRPVDPAALGVVVDSIRPSGFTPIGPSLRQAAEMLPTDRPSSIVLISDGVDTCSPPASCEVASEIHREKPLIAIHVVGFGVDGDEAAQQQMTCIGGVGGGTAVSASDPAQLTARLHAAATVGAGHDALSAYSVNGVRLGMTLAEVRAAVDGARVGAATREDGVEVIVVDCGWGDVELRDGRVSSIAPSDTSVGTAEGVVPADGIDGFTRVYGPAVLSTPTNAVFAVAPGSRAGYRLELDGPVIRRIVVCRCVPPSEATATASWEIDFEGIGPLRLGMTLADARATVAALTPAPDSAVWQITDARGEPVVQAGFIGDRLAKLQVGPSSGTDADLRPLAPRARGILLGDSVATVQNAFPGGSMSKVYIAPDANQYIVTDRTGRVLRFRTAWADTTDKTSIGSISVEDASLTLTDEARSDFTLWMR